MSDIKPGDLVRLRAGNGVDDRRVFVVEAVTIDEHGTWAQLVREGSFNDLVRHRVNAVAIELVEWVQS